MFFVHVLAYTVRYKLNGNFISIASNDHLVATPNPVSSTTYFLEHYANGKYTLDAKSAQQYMCRSSNNYIEGIRRPSSSQMDKCSYIVEDAGNYHVTFRADNGKYLCLSSFEHYITATGDRRGTGCYFEKA